MLMTAEKTLETYWDESVPVDPIYIAARMGIVVQANPWLDTESGHYIPDGADGGKPLIIYNSNEAYVRQRFTVAHELGHHALCHGERPRDTSKNFTTGVKDYKEIQANRFAAELLMPEKSLHAVIQIRNIRNIEDLASLFCVSKAAMAYRAESLGYNIN